ncbi:putative ankyrin repeat protein RF_0381, partial [Patella vulgata]|uniref:putative ankyrin repeat protein RF_0381 n=1 Tax=Patella vulgata TaxID=6465 RepID=UPI0024A9185F
MYCCQSVVDQVEKVQLILTNHADLNAKDYEGKDALHYSCLYSHVASVKLLIKEGLQVNDRDAKGQTPLFSCIQSNVDRIEKMQFLISKGADINVKDNKGRSFLRESYQWGDIACVKLLIKEGLGVNDRDDKGYRPLYYCIQSNVDRIEKIQFLLSVGADTNVKGDEWRSLLHESCVWGDIACVKLLIKQGINVNGRDFYGKTPLFECIQSNVDRIEKMRFLISVGADINLKDHDMRSLLHASCQWGDVAFVKLLIKEGLQ